MVGILMLFTVLGLILVGFPVAFTLAGIALVFGLFIGGPEMFAFMPFRIYNIMTNTILMAVPLFIYMGMVLQRTNLAEQLLESMGHLFGRIRGGLAISTIVVGALLAASTGVVGASVTAMGLISLPVMLKHTYSVPLACGSICSAGTLGQIIPPSIVLIILGDVLNLPVGDLFQFAFIPGVVLIGGYIVYIMLFSLLRPEQAPSLKKNNQNVQVRYGKLFIAMVPTLVLILVVLGSIFAGIATPTESSAIGCVGAILLALLYGKCSWRMLLSAAQETVKISAMIFAILIGATAFSMAFTYSGGDEVVENLLLALPGEKWGFLLFSMLVILALGFFIDFVEITFIIVPILVPIAEALGINMMWFAILIAMNLQTSFLTPPFGFSLFYLKGVAPSSIQTTDIYKGVAPFIAIQVLVLLSVTLFPSWYGF